MAASEDRDAQTELPEVCCGRCRFSEFHIDERGVLQAAIRECHEGPPHVQFFLVPQPRGNPVILEHSNWPKVVLHKKCGRFQPSLERMN